MLFCITLNVVRSFVRSFIHIIFFFRLPICLSYPNRDIPVEAFNAYCWIHSTYIVSGAMLGVAGANVAYPGVASSFGILQTRYQDEDYRHVNDQTKRVKYYQWVAFVLIFQVILFYYLYIFIHIYVYICTFVLLRIIFRLCCYFISNYFLSRVSY